MNTVCCRVFQAIMKAGNHFLGYRMPEYIEGSGSIRRLPQLIKEAGVENVLVVTGSRLVKLEPAQRMLDCLEKSGIRSTVFHDIAPNPTSDNVEAGFQLYRDNRCQALVAFGGGAPMDCAKAIAANV